MFGKKNRRGSAMVEFAIGATMLTAVFAGTFSYGYTFYRYNTLLNAVNAGARYAAVTPYDSTTTTPSSSFSTAVKNMVVYNNPGGGTTPVVPGLSTSHVKITVTFANSVPSRMTVYISGYSFSTLFRTQTLTKKPVARYVYQGIWAPSGY